MGEIAEAMIEGVLCSTCGDYLGVAVGYPRYCASCEASQDAPEPKAVPTPGSPEAVAEGCRCPVLDNAAGRGAWGTHDMPFEKKVWTHAGNCPLHGGRR